MAQRVRDFGRVPDRLLTRGALRALTTARAVANGLELDPDQVVVQPGLYACSCRALLQHLMVVGHHPGLESLAGYLTAERLVSFPTAAVLHMHLGIARWWEQAESCGTIEFFDYPKLHRQD